MDPSLHSLYYCLTKTNQIQNGPDWGWTESLLVSFSMYYKNIRIISGIISGLLSSVNKR